MQKVNRALYEVSSDISALEKLLDDDVDVTDTLEAISMEFDLKINQVMLFIANLKEPVPAIDNEIERLNKRKKSITNLSDKLTDYIRVNMIKVDKTKIAGDLFTASIRKGRERVDVLDVDSLDDEYVTVKTSINADKKAIKAAIGGGKEVKGASLVRGEPTIQIK